MLPHIGLTVMSASVHTPDSCRACKHLRHFFTVSTVSHPLIMTTTTAGFLKLEVQYNKGSILNHSQCHQQRHSYSIGKDVPGY